MCQVPHCLRDLQSDSTLFSVLFNQYNCDSGRLFLSRDLAVVTCFSVLAYHQGSVWEIAITEGRKRRTEGLEDVSGGDSAPHQATLLFVGPRGSGKTTLIQRFLEREETPKPTLALEYTYARKSGKSLTKDVCHIWELGGGAVFSSLLSTSLTHRTISSVTAVVVLDLSKPENLWVHLEILLSKIKERVMSVIASPEGKEMNLHEKLSEAAQKIIEDGHPDKKQIKPFLIPLVFIGGKYDIFQEMEPESKRLICRALRYVAHINGASLFFFSSRDSGLMKKAKELLSQHGFGTSESKSLSQDYNKPLIIPAGSDSLNFITGMVEGDTQAMNFEAWKRAFTAKFPQEDKMTTVVPPDPSRDPNYAELEIDNLRSQKDQELEKLRRETGTELRPKSNRRR